MIETLFTDVNGERELVQHPPDKSLSIVQPYLLSMRVEKKSPGEGRFQRKATREIVRPTKVGVIKWLLGAELESARCTIRKIAAHFAGGYVSRHLRRNLRG